MTLEDLEKMSVVELKAMAYDILARIEQEQKNLQVLNQLMAKKMEKEKKPTLEVNG